MYIHMHTATTSHDTHITQNAHKRPDKAGSQILNRYFGKQYCAWLADIDAHAPWRRAAAQYSSAVQQHSERHT